MSPLIMKIFFLPKRKIRSPRLRIPAPSASYSHFACASIARRAIAKSSCSTAVFCNLWLRRCKPCADFSLPLARRAFSAIEVLRMLSRWHVNTSLSGRLFFSTRWCIRNEVHFDCRMHAATKPSQMEGNMAKKAKKKAKSAVKKTAKKTRRVKKK